MKTFTIKGQEVNYKEVQAMAKEYGIKANQKGEVLVQAIENMMTTSTEQQKDDVESAFEAMMNADIEEGLSKDNKGASEASTDPTPAKEEPTPSDEERSDESVPYTAKPFEFVKSDNIHVHFKQKGEDVKFGWSDKTFKFYMVKEGEVTLYSPKTAIDKMKQFVHGRHGDIKQIVAGLVRIKAKPAMIKAKEHYARRGAPGNVSPETTKENAQRSNRRRTYQPIDADWLAAYKEAKGDAFDPTKVREDYEAYLSQQANDHSVG